LRPATPLIGRRERVLEGSKPRDQAAKGRGPRPQLAADPVLLEGGRHTGGVVDVSSSG